MDKELVQLLRELLELESGVATEQLAELKMERAKCMRYIDVLDDRIKVRESISLVLSQILEWIDTSREPR